MKKNIIIFIVLLSTFLLSLTFISNLISVDYRELKTDSGLTQVGILEVVHHLIQVVVHHGILEAIIGIMIHILKVHLVVVEDQDHLFGMII